MSSQAQAARNLIGVGRAADAVTVLHQALASSPQDADLHCLLAHANIAMHRPKEALHAATQGVLLAPEEEWAHRLQSIALRQLGRNDESVDAANEAVRLQPESGYARKNLSEAYLAASKIDDAYLQALETVRLMPDSADSFDVLGRALIRKRMYMEAEANFRRALELDATDAVAHNNLGVALQRQGRSVEAVNAFNAAARIDPSFETARQNLFSGTKFLFGGGSVVFLGYLVIRLAVAANLAHSSTAFGVVVGVVALVGVGLWVRRYRPFARKHLPATAVAYYKAESRRRRRETLPYDLLRVASIPLAIVLLMVSLVLQSAGLLLLTLPVAIGWYWGTPRLWRRLVQRAE
ncbi:MAG TPA: tetratricopeptide repeat protein [Reyranella sp.]|nr:tetratricopeptide repeat protein [Reyranella sp.]